MNIDSPNYVLEFMKEMQKPLNSTKIQNSAYMLQTKEQGFPKGTFDFSYRPLLFMNSPRLTLEISDLEKFGYLTEDIQNGQRLFNIHPEYNSEQKTFDKRYTNFIKNHLDNIELISLDTFIKNKFPHFNENILAKKSQLITGLKDERKLYDAAQATQSFWNLQNK